MLKLITSSYVLLMGLMVSAQLPENFETRYNPADLFSPQFYAQATSPERAADGSPGNAYWQNRADYKIQATLNEITHEISGAVQIKYTNNSPNDLAFLWLQLDQNLFSTQSRGQQRMPLEGRSRYGDAESNFEGGYRIKSLLVNNQSISPTLTDTRMQVRLPELLRKGGGKLVVTIEYSFIQPRYGADRCGILPTTGGDIYAVAQWYPRMCVYDDVTGWNTRPYLGPSEFYLEYGDFEVSITAPSSHIVVGGGELLNSAEVLTPIQLQRLSEASVSDRTVMIRTEKEMLESNSKGSKGQRTWRFSLKNARDFAWAVPGPLFGMLPESICLPGKKPLP